LAGNDESEDDQDTGDEGRDSDVEIIEPKEEEEDSDVEIIEDVKVSNKQPSPRRKPSKRILPASSSEEDDSDNGTPPAPAPKPLQKKDKRSGKAKVNREVRSLGPRRKDVSLSIFDSFLDQGKEVDSDPALLL